MKVLHPAKMILIEFKLKINIITKMFSFKIINEEIFIVDHKIKDNKNIILLLR